MPRRPLALLVSASISAFLLVLAVLVSINSATAAPLGSATAQGKSPRGEWNATWTDVLEFPTTTIIGLDRTPVPVNPRLKRSGAVAFPANDKIYVMGGRHGLDGGDVALPYIYEYTPGNPGSWQRKNATLPHTTGVVDTVYSANSVVATLNDGTRDLIYVVGGSNIDSTPTNRVVVYDPIADSASIMTTDPWPASPLRIPGGSAVLDNKLYVFGGSTTRPTPRLFADTWVFDPTAAAGTRWTQLTSANLSIARGFIAGAAVNDRIYAIGGDIFAGSEPDLSLVPQTRVEVLNPSATNPQWTTVAPLPSARGDTEAWAADSGTGLVISGKIMIAGGPWYTPTTTTYLYNVAGNSWATSVPLLRPTRNYSAAMLDGYIYAFGGYDLSGGLPEGSSRSQRLDVLDPNAATRTPSVTTTPTSTRTATATSTSTPCPITFSDVSSNSFFYEPVRYLYCRGVISGYGDGTFRPFAETTRAQMVKIIVLAEGFPVAAPNGPRYFSDVPNDNPFYGVITTAYERGIVSGYGDGTFRPNNPVTRGQLSKIVVVAEGWAEQIPAAPTFRDVSTNNTFYGAIETAYSTLR